MAARHSWSGGAVHVRRRVPPLWCACGGCGCRLWRRRRRRPVAAAGCGGGCCCGCTRPRWAAAAGAGPGLRAAGCGWRAAGCGLRAAGCARRGWRRLQPFGRAAAAGRGCGCGFGRLVWEWSSHVRFGGRVGLRAAALPRLRLAVTSGSCRLQRRLCGARGAWRARRLAMLSLAALAGAAACGIPAGGRVGPSRPTVLGYTARQSALTVRRGGLLMRPGTRGVEEPR